MCFWEDSAGSLEGGYAGLKHLSSVFVENVTAPCGADWLVGGRVPVCGAALLGASSTRGIAAVVADGRGRLGGSTRGGAAMGGCGLCGLSGNSLM